MEVILIAQLDLDIIKVDDMLFEKLKSTCTKKKERN